MGRIRSMMRRTRQGRVLSGGRPHLRSSAAILLLAHMCIAVAQAAPPRASAPALTRQQTSDTGSLLGESHAALMKALYDCTPDSGRAALVEAWLSQPLAIERYTALDIVQQGLRHGVP